MNRLLVFLILATIPFVDAAMPFPDPTNAPNPPLSLLEIGGKGLEIIIPLSTPETAHRDTTERSKEASDGMGESRHGDTSVAVSGAHRAGSGEGIGLAVRGIATASGPVVAPRTMTVRITYYTDRGTTRWNCAAGPGIVASDPAVIPPMSIVLLDGDEYLVCDTGGLVVKNHVDVWVASEAEGRALIAKVGDYAEVEILEATEFGSENQGIGEEWELILWKTGYVCRWCGRREDIRNE